MQAITKAPILFPPLAEQEQIVLLVEERLSIISALEASVEKALKQAERMRQAILHRAFTGKLVPQDPNDEPASVLLKHIRQERELAAGSQEQKRLQVARAKKIRATAKPVCVPKVPEGSPEPLDETTLKQESLWAM
jgi:type I restriction enzyme, S subunit